MATDQKASITIQAYDKASYAVLGVAANLETLNKKLARQSQLGYSFNQLGQQLAPTWGKIQNMGAAWGSAIRRISLIGMAATGATVGMVGFAKSAADAADKIGDLSARYMVDSKTLQVYGSMVEEAGGTFEDGAISIGKLKKAMNEAMHDDKGDFAAAFAGVGISVAALKKMNPEQVMLKMAEAFKGSENDYAKQAVLLKVMSKNGTIFMDVMNKGPEEIKKRFAEMRADGRFLSQQQLTDADNFDKAWRRASGTLAGVKNRIGLQLAARLEPLLNKFQIWLSGDGGKKLEQQFNRIFTSENIKTFADTLMAIGQVVASAARAFKGLVDRIGPANTALLGLGIILAPVGIALVTTATTLFSVGRAVMTIGAAIPGVSAGLTGLVGVLGRIAPLAAAAFGGWAIGSAINNKINDKIKTATGGKEDSLGGWIYGRTHNEDINSKNFGQFDWRKAATGQSAGEIKNRIDIKIDSEGRARVKGMQAGSQNTTMDVSSGLYMAGA